MPPGLASPPSYFHYSANLFATANTCVQPYWPQAPEEILASLGWWLRRYATLRMRTAEIRRCRLRLLVLIEINERDETSRHAHHVFTLPSKPVRARKMAPTDGFEPSSPRCRGAFTCHAKLCYVGLEWCHRVDLNHQRPPLQGGALHWSYDGMNWSRARESNPALRFTKAFGLHGLSGKYEEYEENYKDEGHNAPPYSHSTPVNGRPPTI